MKKKYGFLWVVLLVVFDQLTKIWAKSTLQGQNPIDIIEGVFSLEYLENTGIAFGLFKNKFAFFVLLTILILLVLGFIYYKLPDSKRYRPLQFCIIFIVAGAIGNMIDRVIYNYVIDFLYFNLIDFPIFNVADIYVSVTVFILFFLCLFYYKEEELEFISVKNEDKRMKNKEKNSHNKQES